MFFDPGGTKYTRPSGVLARPPECPSRRLPRVILSRLNGTALALAVYASQWPSLTPTQDSLPAACQALPGGIGYPQGSNERVEGSSSTSFPPLPSFDLAQGHHI